MNSGCGRDVQVVETTVGTLGSLLVGVGNIRERDGAPGVFEATISVRGEDATSDAPPLYRGIVVAGDRVRVEGKTLVVTRIEYRPASGSQPGGARSFVCLAEE